MYRKMGFDSGAIALVVDGVTYTFPVGGATMMVGDSTDISAAFTGACTYSAFTDLHQTTVVLVTLLV